MAHLTPITKYIKSVALILQVDDIEDKLERLLSMYEDDRKNAQEQQQQIVLAAAAAAGQAVIAGQQAAAGVSNSGTIIILPNGLIDL